MILCIKTLSQLAICLDRVYVQCLIYRLGNIKRVIRFSGLIVADFLQNECYNGKLINRNEELILLPVVSIRFFTSFSIIEGKGFRMALGAFCYCYTFAFP